MSTMVAPSQPQPLLQPQPPSSSSSSAARPNANANANANAPKRPRLSLQINSKTTNNAPPSAPAAPSAAPKPASRGTYPLNPSDPTAFNTLSNVYLTAIERSSSTPVAETAPHHHHEPMTAINTLQAFTIHTPTTAAASPSSSRPRAVTPFVATFPETPVSAHPDNTSTGTSTSSSSATAGSAASCPSAMTTTPPLSAGPADQHTPRVFVFSARDTAGAGAAASSSPTYARSPCRRGVAAATAAPYTHPSSLHSILRNSPLATRRQQQASSRRAQDGSGGKTVTLATAESSSSSSLTRSSKRVCYNSPLEREIVTNKYTKSHIDLLIEEASPCSPNSNSNGNSNGLPDASTGNNGVVDIARAFTQNELQDGGQTPGPFEDPRRVGDGGIRKRRRGGEKKRHWVWTIGREEFEDGDDEDAGGAIAALRAAAAREAQTTSAPRHERTSSVDSSSSSTFSAYTEDVDMSDADSVTTADTALSVTAEGKKEESS